MSEARGYQKGSKACLCPLVLEGSDENGEKNPQMPALGTSRVCVYRGGVQLTGKRASLFA